MDYIQNISGIWLVLDKFYVSKYLYYKILILHFGTTEKNKRLADKWKSRKRWKRGEERQIINKKGKICKADDREKRKGRHDRLALQRFKIHRCLRLKKKKNPKFLPSYTPFHCSGKLEKDRKRVEREKNRSLHSKTHYLDLI